MTMKTNMVGLMRWLTDGEEELKGITHWMPMPAPPAVISSLEIAGKNEL